MKVSKEQLLQGILNYLDSEVINKLPTSGKWIIGAFTVLLSSRYNEVYSSLSANAIIKASGAVDSNGLVEVDLLSDAFSKSANKYGKMVVNIPGVGTLSFSESDINVLKQYICGGNG